MTADSHCHLNDPAFEADLDEVASRARDAGVVYLLNVGYDLPTSRRAVELAETYPWMFASVGMHPHNARLTGDGAIKALGELAAHPSVVAIGETGLDFYRDRSPRDDQAASFRAHLALAKELNKPLIVHCRDAMAPCLKILREEGLGPKGGVMHCYGGLAGEVAACLALGMFVSFAGNITYPKAGELREAMRRTPGHRLLLETDAPYLAPQQNRGRRNEPALITAIAEQAARVRGVTVDDIERMAVTNFETVFGVGAGGEGEIAYRIRNSLYLNVTKECDNECSFCARFYSDSVQGHRLRLKRDPTAAEMIEAAGDPARYDEIVFCGFGEPTLRLDRIKEVARAVKAKGGRVRLNTNGHGSRLAGRDITPELVGLVDRVSVSLNAADEATYNEISLPTLPGAWEETVAFIRAAKDKGLDVTATVVAIPDKVDVEKCRRFVEEELGVKFRVRAYNLVG